MIEITKRTIRSTRKEGFTLTELLVVIGVIAILASLLMPALSRAKGKASSIKCLNNVRQLNLALTMYATDHEEEFPRRTKASNAWMVVLQPYYKDAAVLKCPNDGITNSRSYLINGWNDWFRSNLSTPDYRKYTTYRWDHGMRPSVIPSPSETITFGEKKAASRHVHMDFDQGKGNDIEQIDQSRHGGKAPSGGSNFAFADNSVRFLKYGQSVKPVNLWAVVDVYRNAPVTLP